MNSQWIQKQFSGVQMADARLQKRAVKIAQACAEHPDKNLPARFENWAGIKAAYRFFSNDKATHQNLQSAHYKHVLNEASACNETILFIQDGSELLFNSHRWTFGLGPTADSSGNGLMFHSCLVAKYHESKQTEVLGLGYQEAWVRPEKKESTRAKESEIWLRTLNKLGPGRSNWVSVGDRGNDIYEFLSGAVETDWQFVVRARHDRKIDINGRLERLFPWIRRLTSKCKTKLFLKASGREFPGEVDLEITWEKAKLLPPGNLRALSTKTVTYLRVWCHERPNLEWLLITNLPVVDERDARKVIEMYRRRWLIEDYHKALKTGCRIEDNQFKQGSRILALLGMLGVIATQLLALREFCRLSPTTPVEEVLPPLWITLLERKLKEKLITVRDFWRGLARLGGFLARKSDGEPGWQTIWGGYTRFQDMVIGATLLESCG